MEVTRRTITCKLKTKMNMSNEEVLPQTTAAQRIHIKRQMLRIKRMFLWLFMFIGSTIICKDNTLYCIAAPSPQQLPPINTLSSSSSLLSSSPLPSSSSSYSSASSALPSLLPSTVKQQETTIIQPNANNVDTDSNDTLGGDSVGNDDDIISAPIEIPSRNHKMPFKRIADISRVGNLTRNHIGDIFNVYGKLVFN